jgi:hypothetical protein
MGWTMPDGTTMQPLMSRAASLAPATYDAESRTVDIVWSTGADVMRSDWRSGGMYVERLSMTPKAVRLERLNGGAPFLAAHDASTTDSVIGVIVEGSARIEGGKGVATVRLSSAPSAADAVSKIAEGILRNVSVGYAIHANTVTASRDGAPEIRTATDWEPMEISIVPIPADAGAQVRSASPAQQMPETPAQEPEMSEPTNVIDIAAERRAAATEERARVSAITEIAKRHGVDLASHIDGGKTVDEARAAALDLLAAKQAETEVRGTHSGIKVGKSNAEAVADGIANAIEHRTMPASALSDSGRAFRSMSLGRMAETLLRERGVNTSMMSEREIAMQTLNLGGKRSFAGAHGTADFPFILANVANKFLLAGYNAEPMTHLAFSYARTVRDLKQVSTVRLGSIDKLPKVLENGEYTYATIGEEREVYTISKYGQILPLSIEMIINDDLSAFTRLGEEMGRAAGRTELDLVYGSAGVFGANTSAGETMGDGVALFNAAHNNLAGSHTALDDAGLAALRKLLRDQTDINGNNINLMPSKLLVGSTLETTAEKLINGSFVPTTAATAQIAPFRGLQLIVEPRIENLANGAARYYMMSDRPWIELGKLAGYEQPTIETIEEMESDQIGYKVRYFVAAKATDFRMVAVDPGV